MGNVVSSASMSLDGYIAYDDNSVGALFDWYDAGDEVVTSASDAVTFRLTPPSARHWRTWTSRLGAHLVGRTLFDHTDGWKGTHPLGVPIVVLTHEAPTAWHHPGEENFHFVTSGVADAVALARRLADGKDVAVAAGTVASQALEANLLDFVGIDLVPVVFGRGRPYFTPRTQAPRLGDPTTVIESERVTYLVFPVEA